MFDTPSYVFDIDVFRERIRRTKEALPNMPLTFSIKANPFLLVDMPDDISHVEVCSPGELEICKYYGVSESRIIYSGVNKELSDITEAMNYSVSMVCDSDGCGVDIVTAESILHVELEQKAASSLGKQQKVLLRLTGGNQFGMAPEDVLSIINRRDEYPNLEFVGIHYYSGTQKKEKQVKKDLDRLDSFLSKASDELSWEPKLVEYGPGLAVDYFTPPYDETDYQLLESVAPEIIAFSKKYPLGIEMGRFLASSCGTYYTSVMDIKCNEDVNYVICDGGIHHIKYHGQTLAMQIPPIEVYRDGRKIVSCEKIADDSDIKVTVGDEKITEGSDMKDANSKGLVDYCLCGSLCTVADVLVREAALPGLEIGDVLSFGRCGAYSVTEGSSLFLSRKMPKVYICDKISGVRLLRDFLDSSSINRGM